jgi:hypothetical protein
LRLANWLLRLFNPDRLLGQRVFPTDEEVVEAPRKYAGMTMNERLVLSGLIDRWDAALAKRDREALLRICAQVGIADGPTGRSWIVDNVLSRQR